MKNIKLNILLVALTSLFLGSCNDDFLAQKEDLTGLNEEVYKDPVLGQAYVDYVYGLFLPTNNSTPYSWDLSSAGTDDFSQTTDELAGEVNWNKVWATINNTDVNCLKYMGTKMSSSIANNTWTRLRQINLFLDNVDKYGMAEDDKNKLKGQMYFWRAWQYFDLVRLYGGVPLVLTAQSSILSEASEVQIPRSSTSECIEQIVSDLDMAKNLLPGKWLAADWGRITSGAAAAMKGRVLLTWASPQFNPTDDRVRWQRAYDANLEAKTILETNGFGLFVTGGTANGTAWGNMWFTEVNNPEAVIVYGFNNSTTANVQKNDGWEKACRSKTLGGSGALSPTKQIMDAFPMKDGKAPGASTTYPYDMQKFYKNRDPRFAKTFVHSGAIWAYKEDPNFKQFTYRWHKTTPSGAALPTGVTETLGANSSGVYLRKAVNPAESSASNFQYSGTDYMELRFAEVVLNLAESAIGIDKLAEGKAGIIAIRTRAGIENGDGSYGLATATTRDQLFGAVINERKVEFAYENKRFWDLRRWLLFNNDYGTCTRLGQTPIQGMRRQGFVLVAQKNGANYVGAADPFIAGANGTFPVADRNPAVFPTGVTTYDQYVDYFYTNYLKVVVKDDLEATTAWKFTWYNQYYFFGINNDILVTTPYLKQTKGWPGGAGVFDPLL